MNDGSHREPKQTMALRSKSFKGSGQLTGPGLDCSAFYELTHKSKDDDGLTNAPSQIYSPSLLISSNFRRKEASLRLRNITQVQSWTASKLSQVSLMGAISTKVRAWDATARADQQQPTLEIFKVTPA